MVKKTSKHAHAHAFAIPVTFICYVLPFLRCRAPLLFSNLLIYVTALHLSSVCVNVYVVENKTTIVDPSIHAWSSSIFSIALFLNRNTRLSIFELIIGFHLLSSHFTYYIMYTAIRKFHLFEQIALPIYDMDFLHSQSLLRFAFAAFIDFRDRNTSPEHRYNFT